MARPTRMRVFLSHRRDDDVTDIRRELALGGFLVDDASEIRGGTLIRDVIVDAIATSDALVAVADGDSPNVMFEAGIAAAAGVPVVIVTNSPLSLPTDLATFQSTPRSQLGVLAAQLSAATSPRVQPEHEPPVSLPDADDTISENEVVELFRAAGAEVLVSRRSRGREARLPEPDLVIWYDPLGPDFGLPLPVEILVRPISLDALRARLRRTLIESGAQTLLVIHSRSEPSVGSRRWVTSNGKSILAIPFADLANATATEDLSAALIRLGDEIPVTPL